MNSFIKKVTLYTELPAHTTDSGFEDGNRLGNATVDCQSTMQQAGGGGIKA